LDIVMDHDDGPRFERLPQGHRHDLPNLRRAAPERLAREIRAVSESPVVTAVLEVADAVLLVLNPERQIVGFNSRVAQVKAPEDVLGLRPGEAFGCVNATSPGGCGSTSACETCGALGAILGCQERGRPIEAECLIRTDGARGRMLEFNVRATPVDVELTRFTVVSLRDISSEKRREVLEQVFFHDVLNTVTGLRGWSYRLRRKGADVSAASDRIDFLTGQLEREICDHRALLLAESGTLAPERSPLRTGALLHDAASVFAGHPAARDRQLEIGQPADDVELVSDRALLLRILVNMVRNALEATPAGGGVRLCCERDAHGVHLSVHNEGVIPPEVQARIFQRSFSTKAQRGRGLGTYSMKLFGERYLGGEVSFVSTAETGTRFSVRLPVALLPIVPA
jgi:signal transduction histidine kinase